MNVHTEAKAAIKPLKYIKANNQITEVVISYDDFLRLGQLPEEQIRYPHEVVTAHAIDGLSLLAAWRRYLNVSQVQLADKLGVSQPWIAQLEKANDTKISTLKRVADALGIQFEQLLPIEETD